MSCTSDYTPPFLAQSPKISGYIYGWQSCAAFAGAMAASYASCGLIHPSGAEVRNHTNEPIPNPKTPGLTIDQVADALAKLGVTVYPFTRIAWSSVENLIDSGAYISLCGKYAAIRQTRYSGDPNFFDNHQIGVPPGWEAQDPLADGRRAGIYRYHQEVYPRSLLRTFAGTLEVIYTRPNGTKYVAPLGLGYAQGFYTQSHPSPIFPPPPVPPQESDVTVTKTVYQHWAAVGTDGALRSTPDRAAPIVKAPSGTIVQSRAEATDPKGNSWRLTEWPVGSSQPAWLLRYGPGVPAGHDWAPIDQPTDTP